VHVHANDNFALRGSNRLIESSGNDTCLIVDNSHAAFTPGHLFEEAARAIIAEAVGNQDLEFVSAGVLLQDRIDEGEDISNLIATGDDHGYRWFHNGQQLNCNGYDRQQARSSQHRNTSVQERHIRERRSTHLVTGEVDVTSGVGLQFVRLCS
jgi:hypothetical protein